MSSNKYIIFLPYYVSISDKGRMANHILILQYKNLDMKLYIYIQVENYHDKCYCFIFKICEMSDTS